MHFVLSHEEIVRHKHLLEVAKQHRTIVCTPSVARNADIQFVFGAFALDCKDKMMYELVDARAAAEDEDEWMYALNTAGKDGDADHVGLLTTAVALLLLPADEASRLPGVSEDPKVLAIPPVQMLADLPEKAKERTTVQQLLRRYTKM